MSISTSFKRRSKWSRLGMAMTVGTAAVVAPVAVQPESAEAGPTTPCNGGSNHHVNTFRSSAWLQGHGKATNTPDGWERWCDLWNEEEYIGVIFWTGQVCDYQGADYVYNPDGSATPWNAISSYHQGCSWSGWFYFDSLDGIYAENKRFSTKWRSDATGGDWNDIGTLVD
jgi:hypothetical protein